MTLLQYHILDSNKIPVASFRAEYDRDYCFDKVFIEEFSDCKWFKAEGEDLRIQK